jgi:hypothetical protein
LNSVKSFRLVEMSHIVCVAFILFENCVQEGSIFEKYSPIVSFFILRREGHNVAEEESTTWASPRRLVSWTVCGLDEAKGVAALGYLERLYRADLKWHSVASTGIQHGFHVSQGPS